MVAACGSIPTTSMKMIDHQPPFKSLEEEERKKRRKDNGKSKSKSYNVVSASSRELDSDDSLDTVYEYKEE